MVECRHRCAVCCEPTPLERAHIRAWSKSKDHSAKNLIALCANCHQRADNEKWPEAVLRAYKNDPCALKVPSSINASPEQKVLIDFVLALNPDEMTDGQRTRFVSMVAAYAGVRVSEVSFISVSPVNSIRVRLQMPKDGAERILEGIETKDKDLAAFFENMPVLRAELSPRTTKTDVSEKGLEALITRELIEREWHQGERCVATPLDRCLLARFRRTAEHPCPENRPDNCLR